MKTLKFRGYSDDTFGEYNITGTDVDNCASGNPIQCVVATESETIVVTGQYSRHRNDNWDVGVSFGVSLLDKLNNASNFTMRIYFEDYSTVLEVDVPDDFTLTWYNDGKAVL